MVSPRDSWVFVLKCTMSAPWPEPATRTATSTQVYFDPHDRALVSSVAQRPELDAAMDLVREGDTLIVTKLYRLARSVQHLWRIVEALDAIGVHLRILDLGIDTSGPTGRLRSEAARDLIRRAYRDLSRPCDGSLCYLATTRRRRSHHLLPERTRYDIAARDDRRTGGTRDQNSLVGINAIRHNHLSPR